MQNGNHLENWSPSWIFKWPIELFRKVHAYIIICTILIKYYFYQLH